MCANKRAMACLKKLLTKYSLKNHIHYQTKVFGNPQKNLFLILEVLFFMKQVERHKQRGTAHHSIDVLTGEISGLKSH